MVAIPALFLFSLLYMMRDIKDIPIDNRIVSEVSANQPTAPARRGHVKHGDPPPPKRPNLQNDNPIDHDSKPPGSRESAPTQNPTTAHRQQKVKEAYLHAFRSYEKDVWGHDELRPKSHTYNDWLDMGLSIVDSIDTMYLMGLKQEYEKSRAWIEKNLDFDRIQREMSVFETTIRVVGGLVSIYDLTGDKMFLEKAKKLGTKLLPAFGTPSGVPYTTIALHTGRAQNPYWAQDSCILSEAGTLQMEFTSLSRHTGVSEFGERALHVFDVLDQAHKPEGLYPVYISPQSGQFTNRRVTLGALGDSFYEYLLKVWILTGKQHEKYRRMYDEATKAIISQLVKKSTPSGLTYIAEKDGSIVDKMDHLVCFAGAMFALGAYHNATDDTAKHMELGKEITRTCHEFYVRQATGLSPELVNFHAGSDFQPGHGAHHYILRPETVESYFILYWITGDTKYQDWGWEAFQAIETYCRTPDGYCGVRDVTSERTDTDDLQQSFFMAETLKYLYLLFSPKEKISLDDWVFNTEAHPLRVENVR